MNDSRKSMMVSSKAKTVKKNRKELRRKRFKKNLTEPQPIVQPKFFDGSSNWLQLQKLCGMPVNTKMKSFASLDEQGLKATAAEISDKLNNEDLSNMNGAKSKITKNSGVLSKDSTPKKKAFRQKKVVSFEKSSPSVSKDAGSRNNESGFSFNFNQGDSSKKDDSQSWNNVRVTKAVAMDCEMVGTGPNGEDSVIARVSIVNSFGECIYDEFVKPKEEVTDYRTQISGVRPSDLKKGKELFDVQKDVLEIINDKIVVGHSIKHDFDVLFISHPRSKTRDTAYYKPFRELCGGKTPSLKKLTSHFLGCEIQGAEHNSVEDAQAAMLLYLRHKKVWEKEIKSWRKRKRSKPKEEIKS